MVDLYERVNRMDLGLGNLLFVLKVCCTIQFLSNFLTIPHYVTGEVVKYEMGKEYLYLLPGSTLQFTFPIEYCIESFKIVFYYGNLMIMLLSFFMVCDTP